MNFTTLSISVPCALLLTLGGCSEDCRCRPDLDTGAELDGADELDAGTTPDVGTAADTAAASDVAMNDDAANAACELTPPLETACAADENCVVTVHQINCCGTLVATGANHSERDRFDTFEAACRDTYPACGCAAMATVTDSGEFADDLSTIQVACVTAGPGSVCLTYVTTRPADGR